MTPRPGAVLDLFPGAPQRVAGLDLHAIAGRPFTTPWLRSYPDVPPRARSAPRGAMTLALAPTLVRHAEHASTAALVVPRNYRPLIASPVLFNLRSRQPTPSRSRRTSTEPGAGREDAAEQGEDVAMPAGELPDCVEALPQLGDAPGDGIEL